MTLYSNSKDMYFCKVVETNGEFNEGDIVYFYITQDMNITNDQSINTKLAPFTATGFTQNLGRSEIKISMNIMLVDTIDSTMEEKYKKLFKLKSQGVLINLAMPNLPDETNNYYISSLTQGLKEPNRLNCTISFTEDLRSAIKQTIQILIGNAALTNITTVLEDRGFTTQPKSASDQGYFKNRDSNIFRR